MNALIYVDILLEYFVERKPVIIEEWVGNNASEIRIFLVNLKIRQKNHPNVHSILKMKEHNAITNV